MSVLIKGMEMPESCLMCAISRWTFAGNKTRLACHAVRDYVPDDESKDENCPLIEIPTPHGRLIDGDALIAAYDAQHEGEPGRARKLMEDAPTVVEAEG